MRVLVNGSPNGTIAPDDRGFTVGDGLFETIAVAAGEPLLWHRHMVRLQHGCAILGLPRPDHERLLGECRRLIGNDRHGALRITWTRGPGPRGYAPPPEPRPTRVVAFDPTEPTPQRPKPVHIRTCALRLASYSALAGAKHLGRLEQVLARAEWRDPGIAEGLVYDRDGCLVEATSSNVFLVSAGVLRTPELTGRGIAGIMRACVIEAAEANGISVDAADLDITDVDAADEIFITNSIAGVRPVARVDDRRLDAPGAVTDRIVNVLADYW